MDCRIFWVPFSFFCRSYSFLSQKYSKVASRLCEASVGQVSLVWGQHRLSSGVREDLWGVVVFKVTSSGWRVLCIVAQAKMTAYFSFLFSFITFND